MERKLRWEVTSEPNKETQQMFLLPKNVIQLLYELNKIVDKLKTQTNGKNNW